MILSRRSLLVSIVLHGSLVGGGIFLYAVHDGEPPTRRLRGEEGLTVVSRPVEVRRPPAPPKPPSSPPAPAEPSPSSPRRPPAAAPRGPAQQQEPPASQTQSGADTGSAAGSPHPSPRAASLPGPSYPRARPGSAPAGRAPRAGGEPVPTPTPRQTPLQPEGWGERVESPTPEAAGEGGTRSTVTRRATPVSRPEFNLAERFPELGSVKVKAQFVVEEDGSFESTLLTGTGNATADVMIMGKLLEFQWLPAMEGGVPRKDTRVIDINLES